ncbi:hypothetical protein Ccrd_002698 [Cynara cardunculus var. scolymus]|uniref:FLZ-type domain-containing protein n=1 Tax=Cynara cardunculus var. scolymus TaxID=59895 RepID=A0A103XQY2_CYNCS|nr:hypothetical protein Ccrd_002698 [Cynara cardunculus var. scolymus]
MDSATVRKQCRLQQNNGLASIAVIEPGFSSSSSSENHRNRSRLISRSLYSFSSIRSGMFFNGRFQEQPPHFLDACFLCKKPLGCNRDIFMYRSFSASIKAMRKKEESEKSSNSSPNYPFRSGAVAAA